VLDERKLAVLRAIVEDYVSTTEPVGSKSLVDRHGLGRVHRPRFRNDMAVLEEQGFIAQAAHERRADPDRQGLPAVRRPAVVREADVGGGAPGDRDIPWRAPTRLDEVVGRTVRLLAQLTRQVAVVQYPSLSRSSVRAHRAGLARAAAGAARPHHGHGPRGAGRGGPPGLRGT